MRPCAEKRSLKPPEAKGRSCAERDQAYVDRLLVPIMTLADLADPPRQAPE